MTRTMEKAPASPTKEMTTTTTTTMEKTTGNPGKDSFPGDPFFLGSLF